MNPETEDEFMQRVLLAAHARGFVVHEEKSSDLTWVSLLVTGRPIEAGRSRFTFILPDTRLVSVTQWRDRREALLVACRALEPWLDKFEVLTPGIKD